MGLVLYSIACADAYLCAKWHLNPSSRLDTIDMGRKLGGGLLCRLRYSVVGHIGATCQIRFNLCFLRSTRVYNSNGKSIGSAVSAQLKVERPYTL